MGKRVIIMGAAGRDFHNFNILYRDDPSFEVIAFTAAQIPFIQNRIYPPELSGPLYPHGIPIYLEERLPGLIKEHRIDAVVFSYSDITHEQVMHKASIATGLGADFILPGFEKTMLRSVRPVISVCAVRTGCGKSGVTRYIGKLINALGKKAVAIRHPMPYGDLAKQKVQRFSNYKDMAEAECTIEEREEYEPLVSSGITVYAGVDYREILKEAEKEADILIWDGGNNDLPFLRPDLELVITDPLRPGHELRYYPGEANLRRAGCVIINKANAAASSSIEEVTANIRTVNTSAGIIKTASVLTVNGKIRGRKVLVIEDGPTLTHGGMSFGAGIAAARAHGAVPVDVRPYAVGTIKETLAANPHLELLLPAMGYSPQQVRELEATINRTPCDLVLIATPIDLTGIVKIDKPSVRVFYEIEETEEPGLRGLIGEFLKGIK